MQQKKKTPLWYQKPLLYKYFRFSDGFFFYSPFSRRLRKTTRRIKKLPSRPDAPRTRCEKKKITIGNQSKLFLVVILFRIRYKMELIRIVKEKKKNRKEFVFYRSGLLINCILLLLLLLLLLRGTPTANWFHFWLDPNSVVGTAQSNIMLAIYKKCVYNNRWY